jgi:hypothetical protein
MNVHDEMSDTEVLRAASDSLSGIPVAGPPDVAAVMARGRARRTRRLSAVAGVAAAGAAAGTALALGLTGVLGPARAPGTIRTAAFTLVSNANGTATLTINPKELLDPAALQSDLAQDGIPAMVTSGSFCSSDPPPAGFAQVVSFNPAGPGTATPQSGAQPTITFDPSAMPAGAELSFGYFQLNSGQYSGEQQAEIVLVTTNSYTCTSTAPDPNSPPSGYGESDSFGLLYGGPGPAGS